MQVAGGILGEAGGGGGVIHLLDSYPGNRKKYLARRGAA